VLGAADATDNDREADGVLSCCSLRSKGGGRRSKPDGVSGVCLFFDAGFSCFALHIDQHSVEVKVEVKIVLRPDV
jgi:hypothetical protein